MPIYEFECPKCSMNVTKLCRVGADGGEIECPRCRVFGLKRKLSRFASPGTGGGNACGTCSATSCGSCKNTGDVRLCRKG
ncbi:MAG: hypothetical protein DDT38_01535 [Firmicutes bacterium]|nr:hypothetical protein [candidate division NPL-UPA2 bacterium]